MHTPGPADRAGRPVAVVAGAGSGIGRATAVRPAGDRYRVTLSSTVGRGAGPVTGAVRPVDGGLQEGSGRPSHRCGTAYRTVTALTSTPIDR